jgi:hypothetical protein
LIKPFDTKIINTDHQQESFRSVMRCDVIVDGVADREAEIAMIVAMGATIEDAVQFIEDYGGNVDLAIEALFRHDFQVRTKESSELAC